MEKQTDKQMLQIHISYLLGKLGILCKVKICTQTTRADSLSITSLVSNSLIIASPVLYRSLQKYNTRYFGDLCQQMFLSTLNLHPNDFTSSWV